MIGRCLTLDDLFLTTACKIGRCLTLDDLFLTTACIERALYDIR